jgi:hypothetical protein
MTTINFICDENQKSKVKNGVWEIIRKHYFETVTPNSNVEYEDEGEKVYLERLDELMKSTLCKISDNEKGVLFSFDSTDEAGYAIASDVYGTNMGYHDEGLTFVNTILCLLIGGGFLTNIFFIETTLLLLLLFVLMLFSAFVIDVTFLSLKCCCSVTAFK